jgi:hypothetical protein
LVYPCDDAVYAVDAGVAYSLVPLELERSEDSGTLVVALLDDPWYDGTELGPAIARLRSAKYRSRSRNLHGILAALQASHCVSGDDCRHLIFLRRLGNK